MDAAEPSREHSRPMWQYVLIALAITAAAAVAERAMGRVIISKSGHVRLWAGKVNSPENSQHVSDWYTPSHVIHGIAFYGLLHLAGRGKWSVGLRLVLAVALEAAWEVFENTPFTIERYRTATIALDYYGDSVLNSVCDVLACVAGFFVAWRLPAWASAALVVLLEVGVLLAIRDNLTLNIVMLIRPFEFIKEWQAGGG
jgi:hypothetical protein